RCAIDSSADVRTPAGRRLSTWVNPAIPHIIRMFLRRAGAARAGLRPVRIAPQTSNSRFCSTDGGTARGHQNDTSNPKCKGMLSNLPQREARYHTDFKAFISRNCSRVSFPPHFGDDWRLDGSGMRFKYHFGGEPVAQAHPAQRNCPTRQAAEKACGK